MSRSRLGPLALESKLGAHPSQSSVWSAVHVEQRIRLAIKVFSLPLGGTTESRKELAAEWARLKQLQHPAIARCYGGGFEETDAYLAYELVEGETLAQQIERRGRLPWETVLDYADNLIAAMVVAHDQQIIHGGLEPDKIMIEPLGQAQILDFRVDRYDSPYHTNQPASLLHYACRAPELITSTSNLSVKSDLYSLGAILYFALTGRPPISGDTPEAVAAASATEVPSPINAVVMECPIWFAAVIDQLLDKDPAGRPFGTQAAQLAFVEVRRKSASGVGVAEHASAGFSPLNMKVDKQEAKKVLGRADDGVLKPVDGASFYEKAWFLLFTLVVLIGVAAWFFVPPSEDKLRASAERMLATENRTNLRIAKDEYLMPMTRRFPDGKHIDWAMEQIDQIDMLEAEYQLGIKLKHGRPIRNEAERLYSQGREYEQFGDMVSALDQYKNMVTLLDPEDEKSRPYINLAHRQIKTIEREGTQSGVRVKLIEARLSEAESLEAQGRQIEARKIWYSIVELYADNQEMQRQVQIAQDKLREVTEKSKPRESDSSDE
ncbi:Serine/threonine-protein kinase PrkC [Rosistilla carotiformis]|uniref:Serine/threonine-protein kinase PrkC n=1 Tax=Rosistilla carotiformis TaxID=2528017 RepID=A0A518JLI0_9BACT|nr:serine/threonine-protein kinase [Rosistilla carotiformis]QDV66402.1 Serine/threonine-protein kinase PrkC [Rosistilla carotiformis]